MSWEQFKLAEASVNLDVYLPVVCAGRSCECLIDSLSMINALNELYSMK